METLSVGYNCDTHVRALIRSMGGGGSVRQSIDAAGILLVSCKMTVSGGISSETLTHWHADCNTFSEESNGAKGQSLTVLISPDEETGIDPTNTGKQPSLFRPIW